MATAQAKTVQIRYYALLKEERGLSAEQIVTEATTLGQLYDEMRERFALSLPRDRMSVAVNDCFANWSDHICDRDSIVFVPPVAGG